MHFRQLRSCGCVFSGQSIKTRLEVGIHFSPSDLTRGIECNACPTAGACPGMFTANTMAMAIEALGMSIPYSSSHCATNPDNTISKSKRQDVETSIQVYPDPFVLIIPRHFLIYFPKISMSGIL